MSKIHMLRQVNLRKVWSHEAYKFTPWLAEHISDLGKSLNLQFEHVETEKTLPHNAGRVDIIARQVPSDEVVVIENQFGVSDDSHCLRLIGYAANADASIIIWVAEEFTQYHVSILEWLNESDDVSVYAVKVVAYHIGEEFAVDFQTVVSPPESPTATSDSGHKTKTMPTLCAEFYRPIKGRLIQRGIEPIGKGGWRGRWRSFHSWLPNACYATRAEDGKAQVFLSIGNRKRFKKLLKYQDEIDSRLPSIVIWTEKDDDGDYEWHRIIVQCDHSFSLTAPEQELEITRQWMVENLVLLRDVLQPYLDQIREEEKTSANS
ncbi:MAG: DUF4268 domain-containing protein [Bacteroidetes bacterium]|nr:DUF4268 domain-containing protein [Bacteroidota bacterium]